MSEVTGVSTKQLLGFHVNEYTYGLSRSQNNVLDIPITFDGFSCFCFSRFPICNLLFNYNGYFSIWCFPCFSADQAWKARKATCGFPDVVVWSMFLETSWVSLATSCVSLVASWMSLVFLYVLC